MYLYKEYIHNIIYTYIIACAVKKLNSASKNSDKTSGDFKSDDSNTAPKDTDSDFSCKNSSDEDEGTQSYKNTSITLIDIFWLKKKTI